MLVALLSVLALSFALYRRLRHQPSATADSSGRVTELQRCATKPPTRSYTRQVDKAEEAQLPDTAVQQDTAVAVGNNSMRICHGILLPIILCCIGLLLILLAML